MAGGMLLAGPPAARAAETITDAASVADVLIVGNHHVAEALVLSKIQTKAGLPFRQSAVNDDIKRLYQTGYFTDVSVDSKATDRGLIVTFLLKEKPTIREVLVSGQHALRTEKVLELLGVKAGEFLDPRALKDGQAKILQEYRKKGYARALVESTTPVDLVTNQTTVQVLVDEGPRVKVRVIAFEGNRAFTDKELRRVIKTRTAALWRSGTYQPEQADEDVERLGAFYRQQGYQDVKVARNVSTDPSGNRLYLFFAIEEGQQYRVGEVTLAGTQRFPEREVRNSLALLPDFRFSQEAVREDVAHLQGYYFDRGYIFAEVTPQTTVDTQAHRVHVTYQIAEKELAYVDKVEIQGNAKTKDIVIRRELRVRPGDVFNGERLRKSRERLYNLGYFEEVAFDFTDGSAPNRRNVVVNVKETKTGEFSFGGGVSSIDRLIGFAQIEQRNFDIGNWRTFTGAGQDAKFRFEMGTVRRNFDISFTEPWMLGHPFSFGFDLFSRTTLQNRTLGFGYDETRIGGDLRLGKEFTDDVRGSVYYRLENVKISNVPDEASSDLKKEVGRHTISAVGSSLTYDTRDNRFEPTRGLVLTTGTEVAAGVLGSDRNFARFTAGADWFKTHWKQRLLFEARANGGLIEAFGGQKDVPIFERFFAGGANTIRGFRERRVGPHDPQSNDPIGGEAMLIGTVEETFPIVQYIRGAVFLDVGNVWQRVHDFAHSFNSGTGVGVRIKTPIGPVRLDLGFPVNTVAGEKRTPRFHFNLSRGF